MPASASVLPRAGTEVVLQVLPDDPKSFLLLNEACEAGG